MVDREMPEVNQLRRSFSEPFRMFRHDSPPRSPEVEIQEVGGGHGMASAGALHCLKIAVRDVSK